MQLYANNCLLAGKFDKDAVDFNIQTDVNLHKLPCLNQISQMLDVSGAGVNLVSSNDVTFRGQNYKHGSVLVLNYCEVPTFGVLYFAVRKNRNGLCLFLVELLKTECFSKHYHSFIVTKTGVFQVIGCDSLNDYHPLAIYDAMKSDQYFVCPRYLLF